MDGRLRSRSVAGHLLVSGTGAFASRAGNRGNEGSASDSTPGRTPARMRCTERQGAGNGHGLESGTPTSPSQTWVSPIRTFRNRGSLSDSHYTQIPQSSDRELWHEREPRHVRINMAEAAGHIVPKRARACRCKFFDPGGPPACFPAVVAYCPGRPKLSPLQRLSER